MGEARLSKSRVKAKERGGEGKGASIKHQITPKAELSKPRVRPPMGNPDQEQMSST